MGKPLLAAMVLAFLCLFAAACRTTPPAAPPQPSAKPTQQARSQRSAAQPLESASQDTQPAAREQQPAAQPQQQKSAQPETQSTQRPGRRIAAASQLTRLGSDVSAGVGGLIRRVETLLGIKPKPARRPVPAKAPAAGARGMRILPPDLVPAIVTGAIITVGCCLTLAAIIAGRRRGVRSFRPPPHASRP